VFRTEVFRPAQRELEESLQQAVQAARSNVPETILHENDKYSAKKRQVKEYILLLYESNPKDMTFLDEGRDAGKRIKKSLRLIRSKPNIKLWSS